MTHNVLCTYIASFLAHVGLDGSVSAALWGLASGGAASLFQSAASNVAGDAVDTVQPVIVTGWNIGIAGGGVVGGLLLGGLGAKSLAWGTLLLLVVALIITVAGRRHAFPAHRA
ncbi:hypothetical protein [Streptomyces sp. NPDC050982]|uniref:hypothetical protein n=1 Tax=Streptomyces sp. NPDC050982 TaxID=3154746 RepID=UPI0033FFB387